MDLFNKELGYKMEFCNKANRGQRGYTPTRLEKLRSADKADHKEMLCVGGSGNILPADVEQHALSMYKAVENVANELSHILMPSCVAGNHMMRIVKYPANREDEFATHEHTDIDSFTIMPAPTCKGLQMEFEGEWCDVVHNPGELIVNVGDILKNNGGYKAAKHRVLTNPDMDRYAMPFFVHPRPDTLIKDEHGEVMTSDEHTQQKIKVYA